MKQTHPGVPAIVEQARALVRRKHNFFWGGVAAGIGVLVAVGALNGWIDPQGQGLIGLVCTPLAALFMASRGPGLAAYADAQAILSAWNTRREQWASAVLEASIEGTAADVRAWSEADGALRQMRPTSEDTH